MTDLTKWPRLIVTGEPVTPEQANDILIRTNEWTYFSTNDRGWESQVERAAHELLGRPVQPGRFDDEAAAGRGDAFREHWAALRQWCDDTRILELRYLNNEQIMSPWIGGPHGWCDWDGWIGCSTYNIGKWPTVEEVAEDWSRIAHEWPFLDLHAQLVTDEGDGHVAAQWRVASGSAVMVDPGPQLTEPEELSERVVLARLMFAGGERGATLERLCEALTQVAGEAASR